MIQIKTWLKALRTIPRVTEEEWKSYDIISKWLIATRSAVFILTALSALIGGLLAFRDGPVNWWYFTVALLGLIFAHAANNLINDLVDYNKGIDKDNYYRSQYGPQPLQHGLMTKPVFYGYVVVTLTLAIAAGVYLILNTGPLTLYLAIAGLLFLLFYTWPLKYIGLGEPTVLLVWGPLMIGGVYYVSGGSTWSWEAVMIGLIYAIGPTSVLFGKHTDKLEEDKKKGVYTLPVIIGEKAARYANIGLWALQFILLLAMVFTRQLTFAMLIVFLAVPKFTWATKIYSKPRPSSEPEDLEKNVWPLYLSAHAFVYNRRFGGLFLLGLIADIILTRLGFDFTVML
ncbi:MAG: prenyltransferase [Bacteroidota bacterium]